MVADVSHPQQQPGPRQRQGGLVWAGSYWLDPALRDEKRLARILAPIRNVHRYADYHVPLTGTDERRLMRQHNALRYLIATLPPGKQSEPRRRVEELNGILYQRFNRLMHKVVTPWKEMAPFQDMQFDSDMGFAFAKAVNQFNFMASGKPRLTTYLTATIAGYCKSSWVQSRRSDVFSGTENKTARLTLVPCPIGPGNDDDDGETYAAVAAALDALTDQERELVTLRFGLSEDRVELTPAQISRVVGLPASRVRHVIETSLRRLRRAANG